MKKLLNVQYAVNLMWFILTTQEINLPVLLVVQKQEKILDNGKGGDEK